MGRKYRHRYQEKDRVGQTKPSLESRASRRRAKGKSAKAARKANR